MDLPQGYIDLLRAAHLIFFAAGMGTALYLDFISFSSLSKPKRPRDIQDIERIHRWVILAFTGLWVTGLALIYVRTGFDFARFSPKLWVKVSIMVAMTVNAGIIGVFVMPAMRKLVGSRVIDLKGIVLAALTQVAIVSVFCWTSGVALGSSVVLKTAPWDVLLPLALGWFIVLTVCGQGVVFAQRYRQATAVGGIAA